MADVAASVLAKLRNKAKASGISYQQCLQLLCRRIFEKTIKSGCEDTLILKGGLFIYTLTNFEVEQQSMSISCSVDTLIQ